MNLERMKFRLVATRQPFWRGYVECEVIEVRAPSLLRYSSRVLRHVRRKMLGVGLPAALDALDDPT